MLLGIKGRRACAVGLTMAAMLSLAGCKNNKNKSVNSNVSIDTIDTTVSDELNNGLEQVLDVPNNDFKLSIKYKCNLNENEKWTITDDKAMYMEVKTVGLEDGYDVYIDNIHTDTSICAYFPTVDGVIQDTMDDRIHNSLMLGFPISDTNSYIGINEIEGQNETFIQGFVYGLNGYETGDIEEKRREEADYLNYGVYGNKIASVIDLIVIKDGIQQCVSVKSDIVVNCWPYVPFDVVREHAFGDDEYVRNGYYYYYYDNGVMIEDELTESEYEEKINSKSKTLTK